ncbi:hypothetical protein [Algoriphagus sediminis]|uniref:hypothetical protein n=1 Tax=Algoriphagus sediminis TaxID=3057113 RepID=UPI0025B12777|nr:hypothetical protein [Algoriphagus sediminis]
MIFFCFWFYQKDPKPNVYLRFDGFDSSKIEEIDYHLFKYEKGKIDTLKSITEIEFVSVYEFNALEASI